MPGEHGTGEAAEWLAGPARRSLWRGVGGDGWTLAAAVTIPLLVTPTLAAPLLTAGALAPPSFPRPLLLILIIAVSGWPFTADRARPDAIAQEARVMADSPAVPLIDARSCFIRGSQVGDFFVGEFGEYPDYLKMGVIR